MNEMIYDIVGIGIGPFNLSIAALSDQTQLKTLFIEQKPNFDWHPGLLIEGTTLQVPFMADLVTMAQPNNQFSYLNYLHEQDRLYQFYFRENFLIPRREYNHYCQWVSKQLPQCLFGFKVLDIQQVHRNGDELYLIQYEQAQTHEEYWVLSKHVVLGVGSQPSLPPAVRELANHDHVFHSAQYLNSKQLISEIQNSTHSEKAIVTVLGSGQSAGEIFLDQLQQQRPQPDQPDQFALQWFTRGDGFFPMEYSKLGLEHFTPDYQAYFHGLDQAKKDQILPKQDLLYKGMSAAAIADIYDLMYERGVCNEPPLASLMAFSELIKVQENNGAQPAKFTLTFKHRQQEKIFSVQSDVLICATGYSHNLPNVLAGINGLIDWDKSTGCKRFKIDRQYRVATNFTAGVGNIYVQNAELHTHGVGAPDLGLGAHRSACIINDVLGETYFKIRDKNTFTSFGVESIQALASEVTNVE